MKKTMIGIFVGAMLITSIGASAKSINYSYNYVKSHFSWEEFSEWFSKFQIDECMLKNCGQTKPETNIPNDDSTQNGSVNTDEEEINNTQQGLSQFELEVLELVNTERRNNGLSELTADVLLSDVARKHSKDMADNNYFSHENLQGKTPFDRLKDAGISYSYAGENIAAGQTTPNAVVNAWMNSSGHRANILNENFNKIGIGYYNGGSKLHYWTQVFTS